MNRDISLLASKWERESGIEWTNFIKSHHLLRLFSVNAADISQENSHLANHQWKQQRFLGGPGLRVQQHFLQTQLLRGAAGWHRLYGTGRLQLYHWLLCRYAAAQSIGMLICTSLFYLERIKAI